MSTRSQIKYKDSKNNIYIYKHSDGYPEGVLPVLVPFVADFFKFRGDDECYFLAQLIRRFAVVDYLYNEKRAKKHPEIYGKREGGVYEFLGWGLDCEQHGDIEYLYEVDKTGQIYVNGKKLTKAQIAKAVSRE